MALGCLACMHDVSCVHCMLSRVSGAFSVFCLCVVDFVVLRVSCVCCVCYCFCHVVVACVACLCVVSCVVVRCMCVCVCVCVFFVCVLVLLYSTTLPHYCSTSLLLCSSASLAL